jgi:NAD(P)-dependent dehydrogenase (short-subunit alcohol dehydrogenase family)
MCKIVPVPKVVLITGASGGIGSLTGQLFARRGWCVSATARRPESIPVSENGKVAAFRLDVTDEDSIAEAISGTLDRFGTIDVLVNNAGYGVFGPLEGITGDQLDAQFRTNVLGAAAVIRHVLPSMRSRKGGTIINVSSLSGAMGEPFMSAYDATKFALEGLSESLWFELSLHRIRVKVVEPAQFKTGFFERLQPVSHPAYRDSFENFMAWVRKEEAKAPSAEPVAEAIYRAATDNSSRLRYPVGGALIRVLHKALPDGIWRSLNAVAMKRRPK